MADDEPSLARALQRNALAGPADKPFWGDTQWRGPAGYDYIPFPSKDSQMADFLLRSMTLGPMGLRPGGMTPPRAIPRGSTDPGITGGSPGYSHGPDQWSTHSIPANRHSSTGLSTYDWYGMRNASTGERLSNPYPNASRGIDVRNPVEAMSQDMVARIERGEIGAEALSAYEQAVAQQRARNELLNVLGGGRRSPGRPANDVE